MWFSLFVTLLILTITFYQGLQGLFSALINCVLAILSAVLAFGYYEDVYFTLLVESQPENGRAIALVGIFISTLLVLRLIFDLVITGHMHFPIQVDRIVGGIFGLITALIIVGVLAIGFQLLDFNSCFLGFTRYTLVDASSGTAVDFGNPDPKTDLTPHNVATIDWTNVRQERHNLWFNPDGFTVALVSHLSDNALTGRNRFRTVYPDFLGSVHRAKTGIFEGEKNAVPPNSIALIAYKYLEKSQAFKGRKIITPTSQAKNKTFELVPSKRPGKGSRLMVVRVALKREAADTGGTLQFTTEQIRLVARERAGGRTQEYFPVGMNPPEAVPGVLYYEVAQGEGFAREIKKEDIHIDFVFEVPETEGFEPLFIEYKQNARVNFDTHLKDRAMPPIEGAAVPPAAGQGGTPTDAGSTQAPPAADGSAGRTMPIKPSAMSQFSNRLPFFRPLTTYQAISAPQMKGNALAGGRIFTHLDDRWQPLPGNQAAIQSFDVPAGMHLLQLNVNRVRAGSLLGQVMNFARSGVRSFTAVDAARTQYPAVGVYAMALEGGRPSFELIYLNEIERIGGRLPKLERINEDNLQNDDVYCFLFLVPSGTKITGMNVGNKFLDMSQDNLVAP